MNRFRKLFSLFLVSSASVLGACSEESDSFFLSMDVQSSFEHDDIEVFIDGKRILKANVNTNHILGVCFIDGEITKTRTLSEGYHTIRVVLNKTKQKVNQFTLVRDLYVGIGFDTDAEELIIEFSSEPFSYD